MKTRKLVAVALGTLAMTVTIGVGGAGAAGGKGGPCSISGNPATGPNIGVEIRSHQPFNGDGNPGFAGPGVSPFCKPA